MTTTAASSATITADILARLDILAEYRALGLRFTSDHPRASGKISCWSAGRPDESRPSAYVDTRTGRYGDSGGADGGAESLSIFDFAIKYGQSSGLASVTDFRAARKYFAERAGVDLRAARGRPKKNKNPLDRFEFVDWSGGNERLARIWCALRKRGTSFEAIQAAGGKWAYYPCWKDKQTGEKRRGKFQCIVLPVFSPPRFAEADPAAWVAYNSSGNDLPVWNGKGKPREPAKMKTEGPCAGGLMGLDALVRLAAGDIDEGTTVWKTAGPSDMLALWTAIRAQVSDPEERRRHLIVTNASGETGSVPPETAALFAGCAVNIVHDADQAGEFGAAKWCAALYSVAAKVRHVRLPYEVRAKHGQDLRDWLAFSELAERTTP